MTARAKLLPFAFALLALVAGLAFRLWHLAAVPMWLDEAYSAYAADKGWRFLWTVVPLYETHPPFYYSILHVWSGLFGDTLVGRRALGFVAALATLALGGAAAARLGRAHPHRGWLIAATVALLALHPLLIEMARQVRPYPLMIAVYAGATLLLVRLGDDAAAGRGPGRPALAGFFACEAAMLWLHNLGPFWGLAMSGALALLVLRRGLGRADWAWLVGGHVVVALVYLPALAMLAGQAPTWAGHTWLRFTPAMLPGDVSGIFATWDVGARVAALLLAGLGIAMLRSGHWGGRRAAALALLALLPVGLAIAVSWTVTPVFIPRVLSPAAVPFALLMAAGSTPLGGRLRIVPPLLGAFLLVSMVTTDTELARRGPQQDWYRALAWLDARVRPGDAVWAYPNEGALPLRYAAADRRTQLAVRAIPSEMPSLGVRGIPATGARGALALFPDQVEMLAASPTARTPATIWLVQLNPGIYDPHQALARALGRTRSVVARFDEGPIDIVGLRSPRAAPAGAGAAR